MVFASLTFLYLFLPGTLLLYYMVPSPSWKNCILILSSLVFYAWGEPVWISLLILSASTDYLHGLIIARYRNSWQSRAALISSLTINLGLLAVFKYSGLIIDSCNDLFGTSFAAPGFVLPIGISFYTFQTLSYTIDVYRGRAEAQRSYTRFLLFVSLFHQLVAGPIVRYTEIAARLDRRPFNSRQFGQGILRFGTGLAKKVLIANRAGALALPFLDPAATQTSVLGVWYGIFLFALQIYFDFSGYSDMAIGLGHMFGFRYRENFNYPYISRSVGEFWRRWHISLGSFFRDYLYIPLGGNRRRYFRNLMIVWMLTGLWHGAGWNFLIWGLYYGILIFLEKALYARIPAVLRRFLGRPYLITATLIGWVFFFYSDLSNALQALHVMSGHAGRDLSSLRLAISVQNNLFFLIAACIAALPTVPWLRRVVGRTYQRSIPYAAGFIGIALLMASTVFLAGSGYNPFLYFRF